MEVVREAAKGVASDAAKRGVADWHAVSLGYSLK
jgi:hypothetical protein